MGRYEHECEVGFNSREYIIENDNTEVHRRGEQRIIEGRSNLNLPPIKRNLFSSQKIFPWLDFVIWFQFVVITQIVAKLGGVGGMSGWD